MTWAMEAKKGFSVPGSVACYPKLLIAQILVMFLVLSSFSQFSGSSIESPGTLGRRGFEVAAGGSGMSGLPFTQSYLSPRIGVKVGTGITEYIDLKVFFFRHIRSDINDGFNVVQIIPKVSNRKGRFCFFMPVGIFQELIMDEYDEKQNNMLYFISPRISGDIVMTRQFDLCIGAYNEIFISKDDPPFPLVGLTAGMGLYSRSRKVFFRTEIGLDLFTLCLGQRLWYVGCSFGYNILSVKKKYRNISMNQDRFLTTLSRARAFDHKAFSIDSF
jgi:hypothetical protein